MKNLPHERQVFITSHGEKWVVQKLAKDVYDASRCVIELMREADLRVVLADVQEVYSPNWELWCEVNSAVAECPQNAVRSTRMPDCLNL